MLTAVVRETSMSSHVNSYSQILEMRNKIAVQPGVLCVMEFVTFNMFVPQSSFKDLLER